MNRVVLSLTPRLVQPGALLLRLVEHLGFSQRVEDFSVDQFIAQLAAKKIEDLVSNTVSAIQTGPPAYPSVT
jgi:ribosomal protein L12E/L44/L45/RPP1/RPP2